MDEQTLSPQKNITIPEPDDEAGMMVFLAHAALARKDLLAYNTFIDPSYEIYPGLAMLIQKLEAVERGDIKRLIIVMPPRHGKSETTTGKFPGWCIGRDPKRTVIMTSYSATLAETFSVQNRDTIDVNPRWRFVFPFVNLDPKKRGKDKWAVSGNRESVLAAGVGGAITGFGAWLLIIDDPVKNAEEANSPAMQEKIIDWYKTTSRTRLTPDGRVVIIMTRWSENDLAGKLLREMEEGGEQYEVLHLPALSYGTEQELEADCQTLEEYAQRKAQLPKHAFPDPLGRPKDAPLWVKRFNYEFLCDARLAMRHDFEALYQGNPTAPAGEKFKKDWFKGLSAATLLQLPVKRVASVRSWDLAWSSKTSADYTVGLKASIFLTQDKDASLPVDGEDVQIALPPAFLVLENLIRYQKEWDESEKMIKHVTVEDGYRTEVLLEAVASQNIAFKALRKDPLLWRHRMVPIVPLKDKEARAKYAIQLASKGLVFILYPSANTPPSWAMDFLMELGAFPNGAKDDQVDALTQLINHLAPTLDKLLLKMSNISVWSTPFEDGKAKDGSSPGTKRPAVFRETPKGPPARDRLSWL